MRIMVTGGAGYIGSVVCEELLRRGNEVVALDDLSKGHREAVPAGASLVVGDLRDRALVERVLRDEAVSAVVHMAASSLVGESVEHPARYYDNNVVAGLALLEAMRAAEVGYLVFSSSAAVYGEPERQPIEETFPTQPTNPYGATKLAFEHALAWYAKAYDLRSVSLRYFNAAGASSRCGERHDPETHLIPIVLEAAAGLRPDVVVYGEDYPTPDGTCVRDYIHVVDLAEAHVLALDALFDGRVELASYNLGCGHRGYSVREVIAAARRVTGRDIVERMGQRRPGDPAVLVASQEKIRRELGFEPARQELDYIIASAWRFLTEVRQVGR